MVSAPKKLSLQNLMDSLLLDANPSFIEQEPVYRQYFLLKNYLQQYRDIEKAGGWGILKGKKKSYKKGDSSQFVVQLRRRLLLPAILQMILHHYCSTVNWKMPLKIFNKEMAGKKMVSPAIRLYVNLIFL